MKNKGKIKCNSILSKEILMEFCTKVLVNINFNVCQLLASCCNSLNIEIKNKFTGTGNLWVGEIKWSLV